MVMIDYCSSVEKKICYYLQLLESKHTAELYRSVYLWYCRMNPKSHSKYFVKELLRSLDNKDYDETYFVLRSWQAHLTNFGNSSMCFQKFTTSEESEFKDWLLQKREKRYVSPRR